MWLCIRDSLAVAFGSPDDAISAAAKIKTIFSFKEKRNFAGEQDSVGTQSNPPTSVNLFILILCD